MKKNEKTHPKGFVLIPAGNFEMGSPKTEEYRDRDELPHKVKLTRSFYMQSTPVTREQWMALMRNNPSHFKGDSLPVENVNWYEACAYANALSRKEGLPEAYLLKNSEGKPGTTTFTCSRVQVNGGDVYSCKGYRLPTEAEWEYAARAGTKTAYYNENNFSTLNEIAWYLDNSGKKTHSVAQKKPNSWGLYDMSGNVWEWIWDSYARDFYNSSPKKNPTNQSLDFNHVRRGGSFRSLVSFTRSAYRSLYGPNDRNNDIGFRIVRTVF